MSWRKHLGKTGAPFEGKPKRIETSKVSKGSLQGTFEGFEGSSSINKKRIEAIDTKSLKGHFSDYNIYNKNNRLSQNEGFLDKSAFLPLKNMTSKVSKVEKGSLPTLTKCLAGLCELSEYRFEEGVDRANCEVLWCRRVDSAVIDLGRCPDGKWSKDDQGRPLSAQNRTVGG